MVSMYVVPLPDGKREAINQAIVKQRRRRRGRTLQTGMQAQDEQAAARQRLAAYSKILLGGQR